MEVLTKNELVEALLPIIDRVRKSAHAMRAPGKSGASAVRQGLNYQHLVDHVSGGTRRGGYPINEGESTTRLAVFDIDSHKGEIPWQVMQNVGLDLVLALRERGARPVVFRSSGGHGIHIFVLWDEPQDAYSVRQFMRGVLSDHDLYDGPGGLAKGAVEVFPKQNKVVVGKFGNQVWLPLAGKSNPLAPESLMDLPRQAVCELAMEMSAPVPVLEMPPAPGYEMAVPPTGEMALYRQALMLLPASYYNGEGSAYQNWLNILFALHYESGGSEVGRSIAHEYCSQMDEYDADELNAKWDNGIQHQHSSTLITGGTIRKLAGKYGWAENVAEQFPVIVAEAGYQDMPKFKRGQPGKGETVAPIMATLKNTIMACERPDICGAEIRYDEFRAQITVTPEGAGQWRPLKDSDYTCTRLALEDKGFRPVSRDMAKDAIHHVADDNRFDSAQDWVNGLQWDGVPRIDNFFKAYFDTEETAYSRAVSVYMWTALAGRVLAPGCQADMVPVLIGAQGIKKSSIAAALVPHRDFYTEIDLNQRDDNLSRSMRGKLIGEISELRGLHTRDLESIKAFVTRRYESWRPLYSEHETRFPRRLLLIGTTNKDEFLSDPTGDRRWLPLRVQLGQIDLLERDRDQLWAEAVVRWKASGIAWQDAERLAKETHARHTLQDGWVERLDNWLKTSVEMAPELAKKRKLYGISANDMLENVFGLTPLQAANAQNRERLAKAISQLGYVQKQIKIQSGSRQRRWVLDKKPPEPGC